MATVGQLKAKLATLDKIIGESKAERRRAEELLAAWEARENRRASREQKTLDDVAQRFPALRQR